MPQAGSTHTVPFAETLEHVSGIRIAFSPLNLRFLFLLLFNLLSVHLTWIRGGEDEGGTREKRGLGGGFLLHVAKHTKSHLATNYFPFWGEARKKNRSILGAIVGLSGLLGIRPHRLVWLALLSYHWSPHSQFPFPFRSPSPTSRDVVDVNKLSERLTSIWFAKDDCDTLRLVRAYWQQGSKQVQLSLYLINVIKWLIVSLFYAFNYPGKSSLKYIFDNP